MKTKKGRKNWMKIQKEKTKLKEGEDKKMRFRVKGTKGITLIALVVTIIVLLILAGISISMLTGQNRHFK